MTCGRCAKARAYLPAAIRARLEEVERRIAAKKKPGIIISYTTAAKPGTTVPPGASSDIHSAPMGAQGLDGQRSSNVPKGHAETIGSESLPPVGAD